MEKTNDVICAVQDAQSMKGCLLVILEALETGDMPKMFFMFNDEWIDNTMTEIAKMMKEKYNISVPDTNL